MKDFEIRPYGFHDNILIFCFDVVERDKNLIPFLRNKRYRVADTDMSYRQINSLESSDVIDDTREIEGGWRKFSLLEVVYLKIIIELRKFGVKNEQLKELKQYLFHEKYIPNDEDKYKSLTYGEIAIIGALQGVRTGCMLLTDGRAYFVDTSGYIFLNGSFTPDQQSHIYININEIMKVIHIDTPIGERLSNYPSLSAVIGRTIESYITGQEREILNIFRNDEYDKITVVKKDSGNVNVYGEKSEGTGKLKEEDLLELFKTKNYSNIKIQRRDGQVVRYSLEDVYKISDD